MRRQFLHDGSLFGPSIVTDAHRGLFDFLERTVPTEYDRIMDAVYNTTRIGGGGHRTFDGTHTPQGSYEAIRDKVGDVDFGEFIKAHFNELVTPEGIPFCTLDKGSYEAFCTEVSETLCDTVTPGQVGCFVRDVNSLEAGEVLCGSVGALFTFAAIRSGDHQAISRVVSANLCIGLGTGNAFQVFVGLSGLAYGLNHRKIRSWELLKGSASAIAGLSGYGVGDHVLDMGTGGSTLLALVAALGTSALLAHLERRAQIEVQEELGDDPRYVAVLTPGLLKQELRLLEYRQGSLALRI